MGDFIASFPQTADGQANVFFFAKTFLIILNKAVDSASCSHV